MNIIYRNACYIYIFLWIAYHLQTMLMITGVIGQSIFIVLMIMSLYAFFQVNTNYRTGPYLNWLNIMLLILTIYGLIPIIGKWTMTGDNKVGASWMTYLYLQNIYMSILPIYTFYYYTLTKRVTTYNLFYIYIAFLLFSIFMFYQTFISVSGNIEAGEITNNSGFFFVPLIPMLQLLKIKDIWKYVLLMVIFSYMLMAMKRGAILPGAVMSFMFMIRHFKNVSQKRALYILCLSIIILFAIYFFTIKLYADSNYFQSRLEQTLSGDSSGRDIMYLNYFRYYLERTTGLEFLIGNGVNATYVLFGNWAHNDWLEFAIDTGALGVVMYLVYWIAFIGEWKNYKSDRDCRNALGDLIIAYLLISLYSMSIDGMPTAATLCIGYCLAMNERAKTENKAMKITKKIFDNENPPLN